MNKTNFSQEHHLATGKLKINAKKIKCKIATYKQKKY